MILSSAVFHHQVDLVGAGTGGRLLTTIRAPYGGGLVQVLHQSGLYSADSTVNSLVNPDVAHYICSLMITLIGIVQVAHIYWESLWLPVDDFLFSIERIIPYDNSIYWSMKT